VESPEAQEDGSPEDDLFALLDRSLDGDKGVPAAPTGRTSRYASNTFQRGNNPINDRRVTGRPTSSIDQILGDMALSPPRQRTTPSSSSSSSISMDVENILGTASKAFRDPAPSAKTAASNNEPAPMKLNSTTGRIIQVETERGVDPATAFRRLAMRLAQNNVRKDAQRQRFYERPGLKRKRLKSERWRKRFKEAFQGTVARVVGLKRQGW
jgi:small subunit ribosomal protein MRP21